MQLLCEVGKAVPPAVTPPCMVYSGRVGGSHYNRAADYICLPDDPEYSDFTPSVGGNQVQQVHSCGHGNTNSTGNIGLLTGSKWA